MIDLETGHFRMADLASALKNRFGYDVKLVELVGSIAIHGQGNDIDVMVYVSVDAVIRLVEWLTQCDGWIEQTGNEEEYGPGDFRSFRDGDINLLMVWQDKTALSWLASVEMCKWLRVETRDQRVAVHQIIMDGVSCDDVPEWKP